MPKSTNFCSNALFQTKTLYIFPYYGIINLESALKRTSILIFMQHNIDYVSATDLGGFFHSMRRIFSIRRRCSVPVEIMYIRVVFMLE